jgi:hypothetical protein
MSVQVGIVVDKVALRFLSESIGFPLSLQFHRYSIREMDSGGAAARQNPPNDEVFAMIRVASKLG